MSAVDPAGVAALIETVAAEELMTRFGRLTADDIREKGPQDLVTVADEASERRLAAALTGLLPGSVVVGEEGTAADPAVLGRLSEAAPVWIIDPLDGTHNFAQGVDRFVTIVALVRQGETVAGWIHDPVRRRSAVAERGAGAFLDGRRLRVAAPVPLTEATVLLSLPRPENPAAALGRRLGKAAGRAMRQGSMGLDYMTLAAGEAHLGFSVNLKPWDHAAGILLHTEAGGCNAVLSTGLGYTPQTTGHGLLIAPDRASWDSAAALLG